MMSRMRFLALALLAACSSAEPADRAAAPATPMRQAVADRGIGGTGIAPLGPVEDRGVGGTGIVGVITGFGSIWVNGIEVEFDPVTPVRVDGGTAGGTALRVGQVAVITATGSGSRLDARSITVRHEVSGPVEAVESNGTVLRVAGQRVTFASQVWGDATAPKSGDWVAVSGLPGPDGGIVATRIDRREPGRVTVHGALSGTAAAPRIGTLELRSSLGAGIGQQVTVSGRYADGVLTPDAVSQDAVAADPSGWFGRSVTRLVIEILRQRRPRRAALGPRPERAGRGDVRRPGRPAAAHDHRVLAAAGRRAGSGRPAQHARPDRRRAGGAARDGPRPAGRPWSGRRPWRRTRRAARSSGCAQPGRHLPVIGECRRAAGRVGLGPPAARIDAGRLQWLPGRQRLR